MRSISLETPEYSTFTFGKGVDYLKQQPLRLSTDTKITDILFKVEWEENSVVPPFGVRLDYYNDTKVVKMINYSSPFINGNRIELFPPQNDEYAAFIATWVKFEYTGLFKGENLPLTISAYTFDSQSEKQGYIKRMEKAATEGLAEYRSGL